MRELVGVAPEVVSTPNYEAPHQSIMSYNYGGVGLIEWVGGVGGLVMADYSHELLSLDEASLDEGVGLNSANAADELYFVRWTCPDDSWCLDPAHPQPLTGSGECVRTDGDPRPVDWDCDDLVDALPVQVQLDGNDAVSVVEGGDDWAKILDDGSDSNTTSEGFEFQCSDYYADGPPPDPEALLDEPETDELERRGRAFPTFMPRTDPMPSCALDPVPSDGSGRLQLAIFGNVQLDVSSVDLNTLEVAGALPTSTSSLDVDADGRSDLLAEFLVADLAASPSAERLYVHALLLDGSDLRTITTVTRVVTAMDADSDGVDDGCDLCPSSPAPPPSLDGCP